MAARSHADLVEQYTAFVNSERLDVKSQIAEAVQLYTHARNHAASAPPGSAAASSCPRVSIRMADLRSWDAGLSNRLRLDPLRHLRALETACHEVAKDEFPGYDKDGISIKVGLAGPIGARAVSPRLLTSSSLRQLVCVEGVATKVSSIKPKIVRSVHYCPDTKERSTNDYVDATDPNLGLPQLDANGMEQQDRIVGITPSIWPTKDKDKHPLETEFGLCTFKDHQTITLQEMPEKAPMGQLPRSVELILDHDLVDKIKPGDRAMIVGVFRALAPSSQRQHSSSGVFRTVVLVNHVQILARGQSLLNFTQHDVKTFRQLAKRPDILDILGRSIAPSIHGHAVIKKALALQLLSGVEKNLENGTHLRGDINILMVGDPSTAKSQLLRSAMAISPLSVSTTGKGSSGVGLTAAVTSDPDTRERRLEAGAMVLADRGLVCIDEFDKMGENDRVAIHEAMEQQTVTIAKAGIHASLNARCSVLAAANPVYGQYEKERRIQENIGLPDSLLSRFDLLFVVLDEMDAVVDRNIAIHVLRGHRYRPAYGQSGHDSDYDQSDSEGDDDNGLSHRKTHSIWQRQHHNPEEDLMDNNGGERATVEDPHAKDSLQLDVLRKFFYYAREKVKPVLTNDAREYIASHYAELRARQTERTLPITARSLETIIRLATAHAKARLSKTVEADPDCHVAVDILSSALYHEQLMGSTTGNVSAAPTRALSTEKRNRTGVVSDDDESKRPRRIEPSSNLEQQIRTSLREHEGQMTVDDLVLALQGKDREAVLAALQTLERDGRIMLSEESDMIYCV